MSHPYNWSDPAPASAAAVHEKLEVAHGASGDVALTDNGDGTLTVTGTAVTQAA